MPSRISAKVPGLQDLWQLTRGSPEICIGVLDSSLNLDHPCFAGSRIAQTGAFGDAAEASEHGTFVASLLVGRHTIEGVCPECTVKVFPVFRQSDAQLSCSQQELARGIICALEEGVDLINVSAGQLVEPDGEDEYLRKAVDDCARHNVLVVAAAGMTAASVRMSRLHCLKC